MRWLFPLAARRTPAVRSSGPRGWRSTRMGVRTLGSRAQARALFLAPKWLATHHGARKR
jgi:hypothetical protein